MLWEKPEHKYFSPQLYQSKLIAVIAFSQPLDSDGLPKNTDLNVEHG